MTKIKELINYLEMWAPTAYQEDYDNSGLIIAEIELENEDETILKPKWLGEEVTNDSKYYNAYISKNPFKNW